jgi:hypothetical protein
MLNDKMYLWLVIISCLALAVAGTLGVIELIELQDQTIITGAAPF